MGREVQGYFQNRSRHGDEDMKGLIEEVFKRPELRISGSAWEA